MSSVKYNCEFQVEGMHCAACELVIEKKFSKFKGVKKVDAVLNQNKVYLQLEDGIEGNKIREDLSKLIEPDGYRLVENRSKSKVNYKELVLGLIIASAIVIIFFLIQKSGIVNLAGDGNVTLPFVFLIGVVASLSTCMAVVGGLCISISSNYAKEHKSRPLVFFHISRIISFFILGGVIGLLGSAFVLTTEMSFALSLTLFFVMIVMGLNLLDIFPWAKKLQIKMPKSVGRNILKMEDREGLLTPILLGAVTFFLPCGFTQSMQIYSLTTGSFITGALTMLVFALGTFPVLALISFASVKLSKTLQSGLFFKTAGILVLFFALFNFISALVAVGLIPPIFNI